MHQNAIVNQVVDMSPLGKGKRPVTF